MADHNLLDGGASLPGRPCISLGPQGIRRLGNRGRQDCADPRLAIIVSGLIWSQHVLQPGSSHKGDSQYKARRADRLTNKAVTQLSATLATGGLDSEDAATRSCAQTSLVCTSPVIGRRSALSLRPACLAPCRKSSGLGRTPAPWRREFVAYFDTNGAPRRPHQDR